MLQNFINDAAIATVLPLLFAFIMQQHWEWRTKANVAWLLCLISSVVLFVVRNGVPTDFTDLKALAVSFGTILVFATQTYDKFWKPNKIAPAIEKATTVTKPQDGDA